MQPSIVLHIVVRKSSAKKVSWLCTEQQQSIAD